jgi:hypothetical protein
MKTEHFTEGKKHNAAGTALAMLIAVSLSGTTLVQGSTYGCHTTTQTTVDVKFRCNIKALSPAERAHHKQLTDKLIAARKEIVETEKGYEFQFSPENMSLAELADWVVAEGKCCPFFDFQIDLEREGTLLCLRLTGERGIKPFIRTEFQVPLK